MPIAYYRTPVGIDKIMADDNFITAVTITDNEEFAIEEPESDLIKMAIKQLDEYFAGERKVFDLPLNQDGTNFQQQVWQNLLTIEYGKTISYAQLSNQMKSPLAIRAIAAANGKNSLWIIVPCHRVIGSDGSLTGYAGGLWRKQWLLEHEATTLGVGQIKMPF